MSSEPSSITNAEQIRLMLLGYALQVEELAAFADTILGPAAAGDLTAIVVLLRKQALSIPFAAVENVLFREPPD